MTRMIVEMVVEASTDMADNAADNSCKENNSPTNINLALGKGNLHSRGDGMNGHDNNCKEGITEDAPDFEKAKKEVPTAWGRDACRDQEEHVIAPKPRYSKF